MNKAIIGKKLGMSQIFTADGTVIPVTVVEAGPCPVVQVKTKDRDGYEAVKVAFGAIKKNNVNKPDAGQFKKAGVEAKRVLKEFKLENAAEYKVGDEIKCTVFSEGDHVDVVGTSKGHGFSGVIQRWNAQRVGSMSHGTGPIHRSVGSMAANSDPSRVFKNKHLAGRMGGNRVTIQNLEIVQVIPEKNVILIKGNVPGAKKSLITIKSAVKAAK